MTQDTSKKPFHIWEGTYDTFKDAKAVGCGPGFSGDVYLARSLKAATECLAALEAATPIPPFHKQRSNLLPITVAMMLGTEEKLRILDFGGGFGIGYMTLAESIPDDLGRIDYTIVEVAEVCREGQKFFKNRGVTYKDSLPESETFDLLHSASAFQYIEDWQGLFKKFADMKPKFMLLSDVFAGNIPTFATLQNYYDSRIPHWFLNLQDLLNFGASLGYQLILRSYATSRRLDVEDTLPMENFPEQFRLSQTLHLLLRRNS
jgi:putative methyltransferase (TIGR04325 family)